VAEVQMKINLLVLALIFLGETSLAYDRGSLVRMWLNNKYQGCQAEFEDQLILREMLPHARTLENEYVKSSECKTGQEDEKKCFQKFDQSQMAIQFSQSASRAGCRLSPNYQELLKDDKKSESDDRDLSTQCHFEIGKKPSSQVGSQVCKAKAICGMKFQVHKGGKVYTPGNFIFHCQRQADGGCPQYVSECKIKVIETLSVIPFGGRTDVIPEGAK